MSGNDERQAQLCEESEAIQIGVCGVGDWGQAEARAGFHEQLR